MYWKEVSEQEWGFGGGMAKVVFNMRHKEEKGKIQWQLGYHVCNNNKQNGWV